MPERMSSKTCSVEGCDRPHSALSYCDMHVQRFRRYGTTDLPERKSWKKICSVPDCERGHSAHGLCRTHDSRMQKYGSLELPVREKQDKICVVAGCETPRARRRMCSMHYMREYRVGVRAKRPIFSALFRAGRYREFLAEVERHCTTTPAGCWIWQYTGQQNYGVLCMGGKQYKTHRATMQAHVGGPLPAGSVVHHQCAVTMCCNPAHLQLVTPVENTAEMMERNALLRRIADLEAALAALVPSHPLVVAVA